MPRISGLMIKDNRPVVQGLSELYGIGPTRAKQILAKVKITDNPRFNTLSQEIVDELRRIVEKEYMVENDLRTVVAQNIRRLKEIGSYRGSRHVKGLPVHGQRTKTNSRTKRGKRVTVGSGRKKSSDKT